MKTLTGTLKFVNPASGTYKADTLVISTETGDEKIYLNKGESLTFNDAKGKVLTVPITSSNESNGKTYQWSKGDLISVSGSVVNSTGGSTGFVDRSPHITYLAHEKVAIEALKHNMAGGQITPEDIHGYTLALVKLGFTED